MEKKQITRIAIIILTCKAEKLIFSCLSSLAKIEKASYDIQTFIVDNGSSEAVLNKLIKTYPQIILIENKINYGFAKGINYGLKFAFQEGIDWLLLLNDDTLVDKNFLTTLITSAEKKGYLICGPKIVTKDNLIWSLGGEIDKKSFSGTLIGYGQKNRLVKEEKAVDYISGTAMLVNRKIFEKIGFLDEDYYLYYDDVDFCLRAKKAGFSSYIVPTAEIVHLETATIKKNSPSHYYHAAKSRLIFIFKRAPLKIKLRELLYLIKKTVNLLFEKNPNRQKYELLAIGDFFLGKIGQDTSVKPL